ASPSLNSLAAIGLSGVALGLGLCLMERAVRDHEPAICQRLGVRGGGYVGVVRGWSVLLFCLALGLSIFIILRSMGGSLLGGSQTYLTEHQAEWWMILASLIVAAGYLTVAGADPESWGGAIEPTGILIGLHGIGVLGVWWLGVSGSPFSRWLPPVG